MLFVFAGTLLIYNSLTSNQAASAIAAQIRFEGEYRIGEGKWHEIIPGEHISSTKGDVTLCGNFHMLAPDGEYDGVYRDEIPIAFYVNGAQLFLRIQDCEHILVEGMQ